MWDEFVYFNKNFMGTSEQESQPICGQEDLDNTGASAISELTICYWIGDDITRSFLTNNKDWNKGIERYLNELTFETNKLLGSNNFKIDWKGPFHYELGNGGEPEMTIQSSVEGCGAAVFLRAADSDGKRNYGGKRIGGACETKYGKGYVVMVDQGFIGDVWVGPQILAKHILGLMTSDLFSSTCQYRDSLLYPKLHPGKQRLDDCALGLLNKSSVRKRQCLQPKHNA